MKKVLFVMVVICLFLPMTAQATPAADVEGHFTYVPNFDCDSRLANNNLIERNCTDVGDYYHGDFLGTSTELYDVVWHGFQGFDEYGFPMYDYAWYKGTVTFTGSVLGKGVKDVDTMTIMFVGTSPGNPPSFTWSGTWRILGGTGELENVHGQGIWQSSEDQVAYPGVHYKGKIHFDP